MAELIQNWLLDPMALLFFVSLLAGSWLLHQRQRNQSIAVRLLTLVAVLGWLLFCLVSSSPSVVNPLLTTLEGRYPETHSCAAGSHIVMLSGGVDSRAESAHHFERMSAATIARATQAWRLASMEPDARLIVAGGTIGRVTEAEVVANYWIAMGIDSDRIIRESRSSNTRENALNVHALVEREVVEGPIRLITSALHMPRASRSFAKVFTGSGIAICTMSVDRQALPEFPLWSWVPQTTALVKFSKWLHEIVALQLYRMRGWI